MATMRSMKHALARLARALGGASETPTAARDEPLRTWELRSLAEYQALVASQGPGSWDEEWALVDRHPTGRFAVPGICWVDGREVGFEADYLYAEVVDGRMMPNWRERMVCPRCGMNNRQRAALHFATRILGLERASRIYITEQVTPVFGALSRRHPRLVGSEYLGPGMPSGVVNKSGIRHEDLMGLSFPDGSLDAILTFDVLEHVPDHRAALLECARALGPRGAMLFSIPFMQDRHPSRVRARIEDGSVVHLEPPMYHGDPVRPAEGVLCYHDFGWDILDAARAAGFHDAAAIAYRSPRHGYLGGIQLLFAAWKEPRPA